MIFAGRRASLLLLTLVFAAGAAIADDLITAAATKPQFGDWGVDLAARDASIKPGNDFFQYANGTWYKSAVIPGDRASTGGLSDLRIVSETRMIAIAAGLDAKPRDALSAEERKLRDLYDVYLDQPAIEAKGLAEVQPALAAIAHLKTKAQIARAMADPRREFASVFDVGIVVDAKDPGRYAIELAQGDLGLPNRDYYRKTDATFVAIQEAYRHHLAKMLQMADIDDGDARATSIYDFEHKLADAEWANADRRDADKTYNPMAYAALKTLAPQFPWNDFFAGGHLPTTAMTGARQVVVAEKSAFPAIAAIFAATPVATLRDYLTVHYLDSHAGYLPQRFDDEHFAFFGKVLTGNGQQLPRNVRAAHLLDSVMGEALGKLYVARYFPPASKAKALELIGNLLKAYDADIHNLDWMTDATKEKALAKLHALTVKVGYPDHWRDYTALVIDRNNLLASMENAAEFEWNRDLVRLDKPVDKSEWGLSPPTVNAYYNPRANEIVFPAAIMQPPFFDPNADDAVNYGGIGAVIGHETSHGFDDQGSKYDASGALNNWWTPADRAAFEAKTKMLAAQYSAFEPLPGLHVNGEFTLGENIADNAGIAIALKAYHVSLGGRAAAVIDGLSGDQRFYLGFAQIWRSKVRDGALRAQLLSDPHSPSMVRVNAVTRNQDAWYDAFGAAPGDTYYLAPKDRVRLW